MADTPSRASNIFFMGGANYMNNYMYMDPVFLNENGNDAYFNQS